jgi:hypothetical protein
LSLLAGIAWLGRSPEVAADSSWWYSDYEAARALAQKTGRPLLVAFR